MDLTPGPRNTDPIVAAAICVWHLPSRDRQIAYLPNACSICECYLIHQQPLVETRERNERLCAAIATPHIRRSDPRGLYPLLSRCVK